MKIVDHINMRQLFDNLSDEDKADVLYRALGFMEVDNTQGKFICIARAMGYEPYDCNGWVEVKRG